MKKVFSDSSMVAHLWAHQKQEEARNSGNTFYFDGDTIYSYGPHFVCGKIVYNLNKEKAYVLNSDTYSTSTSRHQRWTSGAIPTGSLIFHISHNCATPGLNRIKTRMCNYASGLWGIMSYLSRINEYLTKQSKARVANYLSLIKDELLELQRWISYWDLDKRKKWTYYSSVPEEFDYHDSVYKTLIKPNSAHLLPKYDNYTTNEELVKTVVLFTELVQFGLLNVSDDKITNTKIEEFIVKKFNKDYQHQCSDDLEVFELKESRFKINNDKKRLKDWHEFKNRSWYPTKDFIGQYKWHTALRLNKSKNNIETSKGIVLSVQEAERLWKIIQIYKKTKRFTHQLAVDKYGSKWAFNNFSNNILTAGCHKIPYSEMERVAKELGFI